MHAAVRAPVGTVEIATFVGVFVVLIASRGALDLSRGRPVDDLGIATSVEMLFEIAIIVLMIGGRTRRGPVWDRRAGALPPRGGLASLPNDARS